MNIKMTTLIAAGALVAVLSSGAPAQAAEATVGVDFASAYVFRGGTLNDSFVAQPYMELGGFPKDIGLTLGVWGNFDIDDSDDGSVEGGNVSEVDLYGSYSLPLGIDNFDLSVGYTEYTYPHAGGTGTAAADGTVTVTPVDADREINAVASLDVPLSPSVGVYYGVDGAIDQSLYVEASVGQDFSLTDDVTLSLGAVLGYVSPDQGKDGFSHAQFSASLSYAFLTASINYVQEIDSDVLAVDEDVFGVIGLSYSY